MGKIRSWKYRVYPSKAQENSLEKVLFHSKELWNSLLEYSIKKYKSTNKFPNRQELYAITKGAPLFSQTSQNVADRLHKAIRGMHSKRKAGLKAGFPRFKPMGRVKSFTYPQFGFALGAKLKLSKIGCINIRKHREIQGRIKTLTIKKSPSGKWFAVFTSEIEESPRVNYGKPRIGIDLGIENFAYFSDGEVIQNLRHLKKAEERLKSAHRVLSKKKKGSKNRKKARRRLAAAYERMTNGRTDFLHKSSRMLANSYSLIAMEDLGVSKMSRGPLAKSILDCSWAEFARMLAYKAEEAGCELVLVNPAGTTQECSQCGSIKKKTLAERWHSCACGASMHRDLNAAKNILARATAGTAECQACGEEASVPSIGASILKEAGSPALLATKVAREESAAFSD